MCPSLDNPALCLQIIQQRWLERAHATPQHEQLCPLHSPNRIDLQAVQLLEEFEEALLAGLGARCVQALGGDGQAAGFCGGQVD